MTKTIYVSHDFLIEVHSAMQALIDWVDSVPSDTVLPTMLGVDRDWVDTTLAQLSATIVEEKCECGDRVAGLCPGKWEPGCDLGNNIKHALPAPNIHNSKSN